MQDKSNKCPKCGTTYSPEQKFCSACGHNFTEAGQVQAGPAPKLYACPKCGQVTEHGIQYCTGCGAMFNWQPDRSATSLPAEMEQKPQKQKNHLKAKPETTRTHPWVLPFLSILGVVIIIVIIVMVFFTDTLGSLFRQPATVYTIPPTDTPAVTTPAPTPVIPATTTTPAASIKAITIKYTGVTTPQIGGHIYPEPGNTFLVIDFDIENQGYDSFNLNPLNFQVTVNNVKYYADIAASSDIAPDLEPAVLKGGAQTGGKLAFEVLSTSFIADFKIAYSDTSYNIVWIKNQ